MHRCIIMNLENEYVHFKQELKSEEEKLAKFESLNENEMTEMQIEARNRGIKSCKESITEIKELLAEVTAELHDFIKNGGEVSNETLKELEESEDDESSDYNNLESDNMEEQQNEDWIYFKLQSKENKEVELIGCIDLTTINDDEPECEYMQNDGTWETHLPDYYTIDNCDCTYELEQLKEVLTYESSFINQYLVDCGEDGSDAVSSHEFENCTLVISYDRDEVYEY